MKLPVADLLAAKDENGVSVDRPPQLRDGVVVNGSAGIEPADLGADMRAAYDALSEEQKAVIDPLIAEHDIFWSRAQIGFTEFPTGEREKYPPSRQRLVRRHPGSGRKCLYLSAHASHIAGWPTADGRLLLHDLSEHATQRQFVYSHKWRQGDLVIWDNRDTMHRGRPHDENHPRDLRRATTLDVGSTLDEAA